MTTRAEYEAMRQEIERLQAERAGLRQEFEKVRDDLGHQKHMRAAISSEMDRWIQKARALEEEGTRLRRALVDAACCEKDDESTCSHRSLHTTARRILRGAAEPSAEPMFRCPVCFREAPWTDGTKDEFWCQTCGAESRPFPAMEVANEQ